MRLCAAVSTCIVGVRDGCRLRGRRDAPSQPTSTACYNCLRIVLPSGITDGIIVKDVKVSL